MVDVMLPRSDNSPIPEFAEIGRKLGIMASQLTPDDSDQSVKLLELTVIMSEVINKQAATIVLLENRIKVLESSRPD